MPKENLLLVTAIATTLTLGGLCRAASLPSNQVLNLDGAGDSVSVASAPDLQNPGAITVEAWINPKPSPNRYQSFVNKGDGKNGDSQRSYELRWWPDNRVTFTVFFALPVGPAQPGYAEVSATLTPGTWTHVAGSFSSGPEGLRLYTNGVLAAATTTFAGGSFNGLILRQTSLPLVLGATPGQSDGYGAGGIDEVRVWSVARSPDEIGSRRFCRLSGTETGLAGYWTFDDGAATDLTGHGYSGSFVGDARVGLIGDSDPVHAGPCPVDGANGLLGLDGASGYAVVADAPELVSRPAISRSWHGSISTRIRRSPRRS